MSRQPRERVLVKADRHPPAYATLLRTTETVAILDWPGAPEDYVDEFGRVTVPLEWIGRAAEREPLYVRVALLAKEGLDRDSTCERLGITLPQFEAAWSAAVQRRLIEQPKRHGLLPRSQRRWWETA